MCTTGRDSKLPDDIDAIYLQISSGIAFCFTFVLTRGDAKEAPSGVFLNSLIRPKVFGILVACA